MTYDKNGWLVCDRCGTSVVSRTLRTMANGERLCGECQHCEYFDDAEGGLAYADNERCPNPPAAFVEPKPTGQFKPALLCVKHVFPWTRDMANLGDDWSIVALNSDMARQLAAES